MPVNTDSIDVTPTKRFFVDMFTRDIPLEQAILDLVDNSVDGAKSKEDKEKLKNFWVKIKFGKDEFSITDNCGGFDKKTAKDYAFRFGRPEEHETPHHSIGQFGVGMKRALFKFGSTFIVKSATSIDEWAIDIDVNKWAKNPDWRFPWADFSSDKISKDNPGTEIVVKQLRPEVSSQFGNTQFLNKIIHLIKSKHRQFIAEGLSISVNGNHVDATSLYVLKRGADLRPGVEKFSYKEKGKAEVKIKILVAVAGSSPREAGWYVTGNGRVIIEADTRRDTGWGAVENGKLFLPEFHNQFARFRGIVSFDSTDSSCIPWNTTKDDIDKDLIVWQITYKKMVEMMRPVITFLNELDKDINDHGRKHSPMLDVVEKSKSQPLEQSTRKIGFSAPKKYITDTQPKTVKIQYFRSTKDVEFLKSELSVSSATKVGEKTFDYVLKRIKEN